MSGDERPPEIVVAASGRQATPDDIAWVADLQKELFGNAAVPFPILSEWYEANPRGFHIVTASGEPIGHLDVLPVRPNALRCFTEGTIDEKAIRGSSLFSPEERPLVRDLYMESLIVVGRSKAIHDAGIAELLRNLERIFGGLGEPGQLRYVYAIGATPAGRSFMERKGFELVGNAEGRVDGMPLYRVAYRTFMEAITA